MVKDMITIIKGEVYKVEYYVSDMKLKYGFAYCKNGIIYPYMGEFMDKFSNEPGVYYVGKKKEKIYHFIKPFFIRKGSGYLEADIKTANTKNILDIIEHDGLIDIDSDVILSEKGKLFVPRIAHDDNFLSRVIKTAIVRKKIDLNDYKNRFKSEYELNNYRRALLQNGNMSVDKFLKWCDVLDIDFQIRYFDKENSVQPMNFEGMESE